MTIEDFIINLFIAFLASIATILIYEYNKYCRSFSRLYCEITNNWKKMDVQNIRKEIQQMKITHEENHQKPINLKKWVGFSKKIDIWVIHDTSKEYKDDYQYLSTNEIKNFINNGYHFKMERILDDILEFYYYCENFSHSSQDCERSIFMNQNLRLSRRNESEVEYSIEEHRNNLDEQITKICKEYQYHYEKIRNHYNRFSNILEHSRPIISNYYIAEYCKENKMNRWFTYLFNAFFVIVGIILAWNFVFNQSIIYTEEISRDFSNVCIIVCSISLTAIVAALTIIHKTSGNLPLDESIYILTAIPVIGVLLGLFSYYTSYFDIGLSRSLLGASLVATIPSITVIYSVFILQKNRFFSS